MEGKLILRGWAMASVVLVLYCIAKVVYWIWLRPKWLERQLKQQGIQGTTYKLIYGDVKELKQAFSEAWSKPMNLSHQIAPRALPFIHQMIQNYGKISVSWMMTEPRLIIADPELIRSILNDKDGHFQKPTSNPLVELLTIGISTLNGAKWAKRRKLINPAFRHEKIQGMLPKFSFSCGELIKRWKEVLVDSKSESFELDIATEFQNLSADVIARSAFGSSFEEGNKIFQLQKEQAKLVLEAAMSIYVPGLEFVPTKKNKRRYAIDNRIKTMLRSMIEKKENAMRKGESSGDDLLGLMLQIKGNTDNEMTIEDVIEECKLFYFAGQETTATLLTWTLVVLSMHPDWQEKARQEVLQLCGKNTPDLDTINQLKIVTMILYEVLRLYPPISDLYRRTGKKTNLGGKSIPAGIDIVLSILSLQHDTEYWGEDAEEFNPDRFAKGVAKATQHISAFYPFGWGPRICLGQSFAMMEAKLSLALVLQSFSFQLSPSYTHAPYTSITLQPQHGALLILHQI